MTKGEQIDLVKEQSDQSLTETGISISTSEDLQKDIRTLQSLSEKLKNTQEELKRENTNIKFLFTGVVVILFTSYILLIVDALNIRSSRYYQTIDKIYSLEQKVILLENQR